MEKYDVALSFAGEDRIHAKELAQLLKSGGYRVFYDDYEKPRLWGKNLYDELSSVHQNQARYCVMFLSEHYAHKWWPKNERESARARAFVEKYREYILPVRLDDTEIPGFLMTVGYLDLRSMTNEQVYQVLEQKLAGVKTPKKYKDKPHSREDFIAIAREHANIGGWYDESMLEEIGRAIYNSWQGEEILENYDEAWTTLGNL